MTKSLARSIALVVVAALAASLVGLSNGFALDDLPIVVENARVHTLENLSGFFSSTYWSTPGIQKAAWRPLTLVAFALQYAAGSGAAMVFHATSIALYAAVSAAVLVLLRALVSPGAALCGALLFAVHPVHVEAVANVVGQAELWVALFVVCAVALYAHERRRGALRPAVLASIALCYALSLGFKEHALILPALLVALEVIVLRPLYGAPSNGWLPVRALHYALFSLAVLWFVLQASIVGGVSAGLPHAALVGRTMGERAWIMLGLVPEFVRLFLWPARLYADYAPQLITLRPTPSWAHLVGAAWLAGWLSLVVLSWRRWPVVAIGLVWLPIALALVANIALPTGILLAERTLFLPSVGVVIALAAVAALSMERLAPAPQPVRRVAAVCLAALLVVAASHSSERTNDWKDNFTLVKALVSDAPYSARAQFWLGDDLIRNGELADGEVALRRAMALWPEYSAVPLALGITYQSVGGCGPAMELYERVFTLDSTNASAYLGYSRCLLSVGRFTDARMAAFRGAAVARSSMAFRSVVLLADSALAANDTLRTNNRWVRRR